MRKIKWLEMLLGTNTSLIRLLSICDGSSTAMSSYVNKVLKPDCWKYIDIFSENIIFLFSINQLLFHCCTLRFIK